ncbi:hypothetical protein KY290_032625 [Solanum tuberosum]|uniref:Protein kinase domain-containing protein n=1 Tax=Solanum tuberosum TaxID=4113 RepID=A0ABQ7UEB8_SOLTU|nr:hypothetical protein KY290_032625 [Solanum tuberosum]
MAPVIEATVASGSAVSTTTHVVQFNHVAQLPIKLQGNLNFSTWKAELVEKLDEARAKQIEDIQCRWLLKEKEEILHTRRRKPNPRLSRGVPKRIEGKIGQGTYSNVYKAHDCLLNKVVALKKVSLDNLDPKSVKFMAREIIILRRLGEHPNVIKLEEYDLKGILKHKSVKFSEPKIKCYMHQLLKGLDHCHSRDFGLSTFFDPEQSIPLTSHIVTLWYRPPELLLGSNSCGVGVDLWGVGCVLGELFTGKPIMPGKTEVDQLHKIFKLCGSPSDDFWLLSKLPNANIFKPIEPYRWILHATFHDLPAAANHLLVIPQVCHNPPPPSKEINAKKGSRDRSYARNRSVRAIPAAEANAELQSNIGRRQLITHSKARNRLEKTNEYVSGGVLNEGTNSSASFQESRRKEGSKSYTQKSATPHQRNNQRAIRKEPIHDIKGKKKWLESMMIFKTATLASLEKGSTAKGNDHDSKGKTSRSLGPSTSSNDQISTLLPEKWTNMQGLPREQEARVLKDHDILKDNQYFGPLPSASKPIDVDRILRLHDQQIQESVERAKQQKN